MRIARSVTLDMRDGVYIDGIEFPFAVSQECEIEAGSDLITTVTLRLFVDGVVTMHDRDGKRKVYDRELGGDVGEWARQLVRNGLIERLPFLSIPLTKADS